MTVILADMAPSLELCKKIPKGEFTSSVLVWCGSGYHPEYIFPRECHEFCDKRSKKVIAPAPTLQEIIDDLTKKELCPGLEALRKANGELVYSVYASDKMKQGSAVEAALKLWLELV